MQVIHPSLLVSFSLALIASLPGSATPGATNSVTMETFRPDMSQEAQDTAPKFNPTAHERPTTKEVAGNYKKRNILQSRYSPEAIQAAIKDAPVFSPYPPPGDPAYEALPENERTAIILAAEEYLDYGWPTLRATDFLDFYETGSYVRYHKVFIERMKALETLLYAEILEGKRRFVKDIANGIWAICEQTTWASPPHLNVEFPGAGMPFVDRSIVALRASEMAALLATAEYFLADELDALHPRFRERMRHEVNRQLLVPFLERTDYWWMAYEKPFTNNWNPWITSNYLLSALAFSPSREELAAHVLKAVDVLDRFINVYPDDGGCEEGPAYWNHAGGRFLDCLGLLHQATGGLVNIYDVPLIREMGNFMWYASIHEPWYVNFADAHARYTPEAGILYRYGKLTGSENLMAFAARFPVMPYLSSPHIEYIFLRQLPDLFMREEIQQYDRPFEPSPFIALPDLETAYIRQGTDTGKGFYLAAKGGYNAESHNHNDVGNFIVFLDGEPLLIDTGVGTYNSKTFSEQRYEIWSMQSSFHNLPDINSQPQPHMVQWRSDFFTSENSPDTATVSIGLTSAYPPAANLGNYVRTLTFDRINDNISLNESFSFRDDNSDTDENQIDFHFMTDHIPTFSCNSGTILLIHPETQLQRASLSYPGDLQVHVTRILLENTRMAESWGDTLYRITLSAMLPSDQHEAAFNFIVSEGSRPRLHQP